MNAMEARMEALAALPFTLRTHGEAISAAVAGAPWTGNVPATGIVFTAVSNGTRRLTA